jgi:hypothetical protein
MEMRRRLEEIRDELAMSIRNSWSITTTTTRNCSSL